MPAAAIKKTTKSPKQTSLNGTAEKLYTMRQFDAMNNKGWELVDGKLVEKGMGARSGENGGQLLTRINNYLTTKKSGRAYNSECGYHMFADRPRHLRKPDVSFVSQSRLPDGKSPEGWFRLAPDLAAEIVSPNELASELRKKIREYLAAGVKLIWVIDPDNRSATVYKPKDRPTELNEKDRLTGNDVLPGFSCRLADLFD